MKDMRKKSRGEGFRGVLNYVFGEKKGQPHAENYKSHAIENPPGAVANLGLRNLSERTVARLGQDNAPDVLQADVRPGRFGNQRLRREPADGGRGRLIGGNMSGTSPRDLAREFGAARRLRPEIKKPVWHNALRLPAGEKIDDEKWVEIADEYMSAMGFTEQHQRTYVLHDEADGQHVHIIANRVGLDGGVFLGKNENLKSTRIITGLEKTHGLQITKGSTDEDTKPAIRKLRKGEIEMAVRNEEIPPRMVIQRELDDLIGRAKAESITVTEFTALLSEKGIDATPNLAQQSRKINGFSFSYNGVAFSGSQLGEKYKWANLESAGIAFSDEDFNQLLREDVRRKTDEIKSRIAAEMAVETEFHQLRWEMWRDNEDDLRDEGEQYRPPGEPRIDTGYPGWLEATYAEWRAEFEKTQDEYSDEENEWMTRRHGADWKTTWRQQNEQARSNQELQTPDANRDARGTGPSDRTIGASDGPAQPGHVAGVDQNPASHDPAEPANSSHDPATQESARASAGVASDGAGSDDRNRVVDAYDRVTALGRVKGKGYEKTHQAVTEQLNALGGDSFEIGIHEQSTGRMQNRTMTREQLDESLGWLRARNAQGHNIFIRPPEGSGIVMVDDLVEENIDQMEADGLEPAYIVETSPGNFQCWVRFSLSSIDPEVRKELARELVRRYGGDPGSADSNHYGRLAGFTNQKPKHQNAQGHQPYCRPRQSPRQRPGSGMGALAEFAIKLLELAIKAVSDAVTKQAAAEQAEVLMNRIQSTPRFGPASSPEAVYRQQAKSILDKYGDSTDLSRMDFMIAKDMLLKGFSPQAVEKAIEQCSPELAIRKGENVQGYVERTVRKAGVAIQPSAAERAAELAEQQQHRPTGPKLG